MNTEFNSKERTHQEVQELLPRQGSGSLSGAEQALLRQHLAECGECRADLALQRRLIEAEPAPPEGLDPERALARMMARVDAAPARVGPPSALHRLRAAFAGGGWRNWALAAQFAVIAGLAIAWMQPPGEPAYRALGSGDAATPELIVVLKPEARAGEVQQLLRETGARIVDGPTATGAFLVDVEPQRAGPLLDALRADPSVQLAEPLAAGGRP